VDHRPIKIGCELWKACVISLGANPDHDISWNVDWQKSRSRQFPESPLDTVPRNCRLTVPGNDQTDLCLSPGWTCERGSDGPNFEKDSSDALPLLRDTFEIRASCDACASRKAERRFRRFRLLRTCPGFGR
jgi:hypothetical protein